MTDEPQEGAGLICSIGRSGIVKELVLVGVGGGVTVDVTDDEREKVDEMFHVFVNERPSESDTDKATEGVTNSLTVLDSDFVRDGVGGGVTVEVMEGNDEEREMVMVKKLRDVDGDAE